MSAIILGVNEKKVSYEIRNNIIVLKKNNNIVFELPIPKGYSFAGDRVVGENYIELLITPYELNKPHFIPEGYANLEIKSCGLWGVEEVEKDPKLFKKRELFYLDTAVLKKEDFIEPMEGKINLSDLGIPKSFWFSNQHRDFVQDFVGTDTWIRIDDIPKFLEKFDPRARLINEYECMSIIAHNRLVPWCKVNFDAYPDSYYQDHGEYFLGYRGVFIENWFKIVSSMENPKVYRNIVEKDFAEDPFYRNRANTSPTNKMTPNFVIPVIDEEAEKAYKLQYANKIN